MKSTINSLTKEELIKEIKEILEEIEYGSIEIYVQDKKVTQVSVRSIKKTSISIRNDETIEQNGNQRRTFTITHFQRSE